MSQATLGNEFLDQTCAVRRLLDLQQVTRPGHEVVIVFILGPERVVGLRHRRRAFRVGSAPISGADSWCDRMTTKPLIQAWFDLTPLWHVGR